MLIEIVRHTPYWVWIVLAVLLRRGYAMTRPQQLPRERAALLPAALLLLSLAGVVTSFGARPDVLACWAAALLLAAYEAQRGGPAPGPRYLPQQRSFAVPGSWTPLLLIVLIFTLKYAVGVALALHGELHRSAGFALGIGSAYGGLSGVFLGRALRLWQAWRLETARPRALAS